MQKLILIAILFPFTFVIGKNSFSQIQKTHYFGPFQGKAFVTIVGNHVSIFIGKRKITGIYKSSKVLLTNDSDEIEYRKYAGKYHYGTYYVIAKDYLSILESENGEYAYSYELCK
jgi:hypothetical protein